MSQFGIRWKSTKLGQIQKVKYFTFFFGESVPSGIRCRGLAFTHLPASLSYFFGFSYAPLGVCRCLNELKCAKPCCQCFAYLYYNYFWSINTGSSVLRTSTSLFNHIFCSSVLRQPSSTSSSYDFFCGEVSAIHEEESCGLHTSIMINAQLD